MNMNLALNTSKITKKITRKGCRNVQLVWHPCEWQCGEVDCDGGEWLIEKIHPDKPATYITRTERFEADAIWGTVKKTVVKFNDFPRMKPIRD